MPKDGISIYFTITDKASPTLASIGDKTKALDKETQQLAQSYEALQKANESLTKRQAELQKALQKAKAETKDAKKAFDEMKDAASADAYDKAIQHQEELRNQLALTNKALRENESIYKQNMEAVRKRTLAGDSAEGLDENDLLGSLSKAGLTKVLGDSLSGALSFGLESALGQPLASAVDSVLTGAVSGLALGGLPGLVIGAASGVISGATQVFAAKDDAFKEYYAGLYEDVNAGTEDMISSGSTTAGSREQTQMAFAKRLGGSEAADAYLEKVEDFAAFTNYGYDEITNYAKLLMNTYDSDAVFGVLQSLSDATAGLSLSSSDVSVMISGLNRMRTTGKTTQEYLNYFSERGVDVYSALGNALGVDKSGIAEMVTDGEIGGEFAAQAILDYIDSQYGGLSEDLMSTYDAMTDNLSDIMTSIEAAGGEGYNEMRKTGLAAETEAYGGELGDALQEINRISGENQAYLENLSGQYQREALAAVLMGQETTVFTAEDQQKLAELREAFLTAQEAYERGDELAGLEMEAAKENAEALATAAYESSDQYQKLQDVQLDQIEAIRENTAGLAAATNAYLTSQEFSKGQFSDFNEYRGTADSNAGWQDDGGNYHPGKTESAREDGWYDDGGNWHAYAYGLNRVPYDNYPALLHEGERVLTASQARAQDASHGAGTGGLQIVITGNNFQGTGEEMADQIAEILAGKLERASIAAAPR